MAIVIIDQDRCKGCGLCVAFCPKDNLQIGDQLNTAGLKPAVVKSQENCTGCKICALMCPEACIEIYRETAEVVAGE